VISLIKWQIDFGIYLAIDRECNNGETPASVYIARPEIWGLGIRSPFQYVRANLFVAGKLLANFQQFLFGFCFWVLEFLRTDRDRLLVSSYFRNLLKTLRIIWMS